MPGNRIHLFSFMIMACTKCRWVETVPPICKFNIFRMRFGSFGALGITKNKTEVLTSKFLGKITTY